MNSKDADAKEAPSLGASVYLTPFSDDGHIGKLSPTRLYASDHPKIAFEQYYYYSQPLDGGRDANAIEDFFNPVPTKYYIRQYS